MLPRKFTPIGSCTFRPRILSRTGKDEAPPKPKEASSKGELFGASELECVNEKTTWVRT